MRLTLVAPDMAVAADGKMWLLLPSSFGRRRWRPDRATFLGHDELGVHYVHDQYGVCRRIGPTLDPPDPPEYEHLPHACHECNGCVRIWPSGFVYCTGCGITLIVPGRESWPWAA